MMLPNKDGVTVYKHLMEVKRMKEMGGQEALIPELIEYEQADYPDELFPYWKSFLELSKRRTQGEAGPLPLSWQDISAWASLNEHKPSRLEVQVITSCDEVWLSVWADKHKQEKTKGK